jgi:hypothetical protein
MDKIFYRKGTICTGSFINEQVIGYNVFIQFSGGSLEDHVHISNKILFLIKDYSGVVIAYDPVPSYNSSHISAEFKLEEAADYFIKNLKLEFDAVQK